MVLCMVISNGQVNRIFVFYYCALNWIRLAYFINEVLNWIRLAYFINEALNWIRLAYFINVTLNWIRLAYFLTRFQCTLSLSVNKLA